MKNNMSIKNYVKKLTKTKVPSYLKNLKNERGELVYPSHSNMEFKITEFPNYYTYVRVEEKKFSAKRNRKKREKIINNFNKRRTLRRKKNASETNRK